MNTINNKESLILIIDVQEKLSKMQNCEIASSNAVKIAKAAGILNIQTIITEQYPKGLGSTLEEIKSAVPNAKYFEKTFFSAMKENNFKDIIKKEEKKQIIIFGIESHICVLQTALDLLNNNYEVFVVENASGSRNENDKQIAMQRLRHAGAQTVTTEMVLFELLEGSKHPNFKEVQSLIK